MTGILPSAVNEGVLDPTNWADHTMWWSERSRSRALLWPSEDDWFSNDPLGMKAHTHPDASEVFFVAAGSMRLTVGRTPIVLESGDYCLVPPGTYHEPLNVGDEDLCVWVVVAPNWRGCRWKAENFDEADFLGSPAFEKTDVARSLPSDALVAAEVISLMPGKELGRESFSKTERALYVLDGVVDMSIERLSGRIGPHEFVNVMAGATHTLRSVGSDPARVLSVKSFDPRSELNPCTEPSPTEINHD